jgi:predicted nucleic acid-binding protein
MSEGARSTAVFAVFDASVFVRTLAERDAAAVEWVRRAMRREVTVAVPDLVFAEIGNALGVYVRDSTLTLDGAVRRVALVRRIPLEVRTLEVIVEAALGVAISRGLSIYDACYAVLAEAEDALLVTADRRLADSVTRAELI